MDALVYSFVVSNSFSVIGVVEASIHSYPIIWANNFIDSLLMQLRESAYPPEQQLRFLRIGSRCPHLTEEDKKEIASLVARAKKAQDEIPF